MIQRKSSGKATHVDRVQAAIMQLTIAMYAILLSSMIIVSFCLDICSNTLLKSTGYLKGFFSMNLKVYLLFSPQQIPS